MPLPFLTYPSTALANLQIPSHRANIVFKYHGIYRRIPNFKSVKLTYCEINKFRAQFAIHNCLQDNFFLQYKAFAYLIFQFATVLT